MEDRRQTQVAGDKLRCRNNNRYPTPSRRVSTEHGINKNRWSSYGDNRMTRFDEHQDGHAGSKENPQSQNVQHDNIDRQSSLLEIFEAELAKKSGPAAGGSGLSITTGVSRTKVFHESSAVFRAKGWHELSAVFLQDADSAHRTHLQYIGDALLGFRNVTGDFLNLGKGLIAGDAHEKAQSFQRSSNVMKISDNPRTTSLDIQTTDVSRTSILPVDARPKKEDFELGQQSSPRNKSDIAVLQGPNMDCHSEVSTESGYRATKFMPRIVPGRFRYVYSDCLQGPRSAKTFEEESDRGYASSTPIVTRFPTLSRFENQSLSQNAVPASSFPPLPSMELLVPARTTSPLVEHDGTRKSRDNLLSSSGASDVFKANYSRTTELSEHLLPRPDGNFLASTSHNSAVTSRLAKAFDALEAESAARHYLTEEIRRNATSECSGRKQTETRRRPHSEAVGRTGRLAVFPDAGQRPLTTESEALNCLNANKENFKGRAHAGSTPQGSIPADASYFDQHHDDCTVSKIHDCVEQLIDMGFGGNSANGERLLVYAQAADGELIEAIDVIDEEQRAYRSRGLS